MPEADDGQHATRPYHSPLRERQAAETRELILEALARVIADAGATEFTVEDVAERAEVAPRTVYRHFPNRQALLDGLTELLDQRFADLRAADEISATHEDIELADELVAIIPEIMARFDELEPFSSAMVLTANRGMLRSQGHDQRTQDFYRILTPKLEGLEPQQREATFAVIRHLLSSTTWFALRKEFGVDSAAAGHAVARAIEAILDGAAARGRPG